MQNLVTVYNKIIVSYNYYAKKGIPYRSEAIADFMQGNVLDEVQSFFQEADIAQQMDFAN